MGTEVIVALIAAAGTIVGSFAGVMASSRLTTFRLQKLEEEVKKHNGVIERVYRLEEGMKDVHYRINELRDK